MAKASRSAYTSFAAEDSIYLEVSEESSDSGGSDNVAMSNSGSASNGSGSESGGGVKFKVSQVTTSFPINGIPQATVMLAVGRDTRNPDTRAAVHENSKILKSMNVAKVYGSFQGQYKPDKDWPDSDGEPFLLFDGYLSGFSYRKLNGKVYAVVNINHWLIDLTMTSVLTDGVHPASPSDLRNYAIGPSSQLQGTGSGGKKGNAFLLGYEYFDDMLETLDTDLWQSIRTILNGLSENEFLSNRFKTERQLVELDDISENGRAKKALDRIEGPEYEFGAALELVVSDSDGPIGVKAIDTLAKTSLESIKHNTTWDLLVGSILPMFGLELHPGIDKAIITPSLPAYRDSLWRVVEPNEFISIDTTAAIPKPVRGVMVYGGLAGDTDPLLGSEAVTNGVVGMAGHGTKGSVILIRPPAWLSELSAVPGQASETSGQKEGEDLPTSGNPVPEIKTKTVVDDEVLTEVQEIMDKYADMVYVQSVLRGRTGTLTGRLRYDIAPGSHIKIEGSPEKFLGGEDELGGAVYAQVNRVTVSINADGPSPSASTAFGLSYVRSEEENADDATSLPEHPYYKADSMVQGMPLLGRLNTDAEDGDA